ncbi:MAG: hypothetical protein ABIZ07_00290 [Dermatophilaceae bacterium]
MSHPVNRPTLARAVAAGGTVVQALVLAGFGAFYVVEMVAGATDDLTRAATSALLILVFAALLLVLARGWGREVDWPRTPTLLWNALLLPVAWSLYQSDRPLVALAVAVVAILTGAASLAVPPRDPIGAEEADTPPR